MKKIFIGIIITIIIAATYLELDSAHTTNLKSNDPSPSNYSVDMSKRYAAYTKITYCPSQAIKNWTCKDCKTYKNVQDLKLIQNTKKDIFAYTFYDSDINKIVIAWRGTIDFKNQVTDFEYAKVPYTCTLCQVHLGFYQGFRAVAKEVHDSIQDLVKKYPNAKVTSTGHSLGGALSTIAAIQINKRSPKLVNEIHNFGCPRVGNQKLAAYIKNEFPSLYRIVHSHDIFTHLPQTAQNYFHYPFEILYDEKMSSYQICDQSGEDPTCSNSYSPNYNQPDHWFYFYPMNSTGC